MCGGSCPSRRVAWRWLGRHGVLEHSNPTHVCRRSGMPPRARASECGGRTDAAGLGCASDPPPQQPGRHGASTLSPNRPRMPARLLLEWGCVLRPMRTHSRFGLAKVRRRAERTSAARTVRPTNSRSSGLARSARCDSVRGACSEVLFPLVSRMVLLGRAAALTQRVFRSSPGACITTGRPEATTRSRDQSGNQTTVARTKSGGSLGCVMLEEIVPHTSVTTVPRPEFEDLSA